MALRAIPNLVVPATRRRQRDDRRLAGRDGAQGWPGRRSPCHDRRCPTFDRREVASVEGVMRGAYIAVAVGRRRAGGDPDRDRLRGPRSRSTAARQLDEASRARRVDAVLGALRRAAAGLPRRGAAAVGRGAPLGRGGHHVRLGAVGRRRGTSIGVDRFGASAPYQRILEELGLTVDAVAAAATGVLERVAIGRRDCNGEIETARAERARRQRLVRHLARDLLETGELARMIEEDAVVGVTSNPTIFEKAIAEGDRYDEQIRALAGGIRHARGVLRARDRRHPRRVRPPASRPGRDRRCRRLRLDRGRPDAGVRPGGDVRAGDALSGEVERPNLYVKIPATADRPPAIEDSIAQGKSINITLIFSLRATPPWWRRTSRSRAPRGGRR